MDSSTRMDKQTKSAKPYAKPTHATVSQLPSQPPINKILMFTYTQTAGELVFSNNDDKHDPVRVALLKL